MKNMKSDGCPATMQCGQTNCHDTSEISVRPIYRSSQRMGFAAHIRHNARKLNYFAE